MTRSKPVFIDASGWIALFSSDDRFHEIALELFDGFGKRRRRLVTTDWVIAETGNGLARTRARAELAENMRIFLSSPFSQLVRINVDLFWQALRLYSQVSDKVWGLVDCASFVVMRERRIMEAATTDRHFKQAGFQCLLPTK